MDDSIIERLVQIGTVSAVNTSSHMVRVLFTNTGITSNWLPVLQSTPSLGMDAAGSHTHTGSVEIGNADGHTHDATLSVDEAGGHRHSVRASAWMPRVKDTVVVLFLPSENSDGFVIGGI